MEKRIFGGNLWRKGHLEEVSEEKDIWKILVEKGHLEEISGEKDIWRKLVEKRTFGGS